MKNIFEIMKEYGLEVPEEKKKDFEKTVLDNYKTVSDYEIQSEKLKTTEGKVTTLTESLDKFKDVNVDELNSTIATLKTDLANKDQELKDKIADRDFNDLLKDSITSAKGRNAKAITALLDLETLKASKNQKEDITAALKTLAEAEDSKMLFGEPEPYVLGKGDPIGSVIKTGNQDSDATMRAVMGLPPVTTEQK
nr:MAG TPA: minor structural protein [Caudoviricetes sp.]